MPPHHESELRHIENKLYDRMLRNASIGFTRSAVVGALVGLALGALVATAIGAGLLPALPFVVMHGTGLAAALGVGAQWALGFASVAGGFGAVAGIQSTRDGRRYLEMDTLASELQQKQAQTSRSAGQEIQYGHAASAADHASSRFQDRLTEQALPGATQQR